MAVQAKVVDIIIATDVVEHLHSPNEFFLNAKRVLRDKGLLFVSTPNPGSVGARTKGRDWAGHKDPTHIGVRAPQEWRKMLEANGFTIEREGADFLWDIPYPVPIPELLQKMLLIPPRLIMDFLFGFLPWAYGENYYFIVRQST